MDNPLTTEGRNPASEALDTLSALEIARLMNAEDERVAPAVGRVAPAIAEAIDAIADRLRRGGRLIYLGAGTSGRLGVLDATECPPTFNSPPGQVVGLIAGGYDALTRAVEGAEDRPELAIADLDGVALGADDAVVGIATSGRTPYVIAGLDHARTRGALTIALSCNDASAIVGHAELAITPIVGPEVLSGSTRLKAGTATKMVLNMLTTGAMVRLGKTFGNLMVDLRATNQKLRERTERIVRELTGLDADEVSALLARCDGELKTAVVAHHYGIPALEARQRLSNAKGQLRSALHPAQTPGRRAQAEDLVIGIDVGGTSTVAALARVAPGGEPQVIARGVAGPGNPQTVGWERTVAEVQAAIGRALLQARLPEDTTVAAMAIAAAGVGRPTDRARLTARAVGLGWAGTVEVVNDAEAILAAGTPDGCGIAVISGTGSLVVGRSNDGRLCRAGGWGPLLGDQGSGYAIALAGLQAVARACDGIGPPTHLRAAIFAAWGIDANEQLVPAAYEPARSRASIAALAPLVIEAAAGGDEVSIAIVDAAARALAGQVAAVAAKLGTPSARWPLAVAGGVLANSKLFRQRLLEQIDKAGTQVIDPTLVADPVSGAVRMASRLMTSA